jgi:glutamine synthetase
LARKQPITSRNWREESDLIDDFDTACAIRGPELERLQAELKADGVRFLQTYFPDNNGNLRTKIGPFKLSARGEAVNCSLPSTAHGEGAPMLQPIFPTELSNERNGFPNMRGLADPATLRRHEWGPEWASVIVDSFDVDGPRSGVDMRAVLRRLERRGADLGYEFRFALEYEFGIFEADKELMREGRYRDLKPWGDGDINYTMMRSQAFKGFFAELIRRGAAVGITVCAVTTEYGYGMYEYALGPKSPLEAADDAARMKLVLQELCLEHGLVATFMARFLPMGQHSACGAHHHQSIWKDGVNITLDGPDRLSTAGRHYLGGLLRHLPESHLLFRPTVNSYRRFDRGAWSPTTTSWGFEDRTKSIRAISLPTAEAGRFEHRAPGADINPYLSVAAMLAAGIDGLENRIDPDRIELRELPSTLEASLAAFRASPFIEATFGPVLRDHYAGSRQFELDAFQSWLDRQITDFEFRRYFMCP